MCIDAFRKRNLVLKACLLPCHSALGLSASSQCVEVGNMFLYDSLV